jgi:N-acetylglucosamine-6-phosphate deacetylase
MKIISGYNYSSGKYIKVISKDGVITSVNDVAPELSEDKIIAPGLVDIQINGFNGIDLNSEDLTPPIVRDLTLALWEKGVTTFFPTIITNSSDAITYLVSVISDACNRYPEVKSAVGGIHLEGPFISPEEGPRGAHPEKYVRPPSWEQFLKWQAASGERIRIVTLSPEWQEAEEFIIKCVRTGIIAAIGHTAASPERITEAVSAGATLSTHLGNASHRMMHRHHNYIWEQLASDNLFISMITDGCHLPDSMIKVFLAAKKDKALIISDSTKFAGMEPGDYLTHIGGNVTLTNNGRLHLRDTPEVLAGSGMTILDCVNHILSSNLESFSQSWNRASLYPYRFVNKGKCYGISKGSPADMVIIDINQNKINILKTIKDGKTVFEGPACG